ncbi:hypothetical protein [Halocatena marina]|nr:hypothetical protein [Halocatena marina]
MEIDYSAAKQFISYVDNESTISEVWNHPAYEIARTHAALLGRDLSREDITEAMTENQTVFSTGENLEDNREDIIQLINHIHANESNWTEQVDQQLKRITPDENVSNLSLFLAIEYELGIGLQQGAYVNLNEPLFLQQPRQLLYTAIHESSHVLYDRVHNFSTELGLDTLNSRENQQTIFYTLVHSEGYATYTPLKLRTSDGNVGKHNHLICEDYRVLTEEPQLRQFVQEYDSFRETLQEASVARETLMSRIFGGSRLPYRIGCLLLDGIEKKQRLEEVQNAFYMEPETFVREYDWILDEYRD